MSSVCSIDANSRLLWIFFTPFCFLLAIFVSMFMSVFDMLTREDAGQIKCKFKKV